MNCFISGGCKNGKSIFAQKLAKKMADEKNLPLYYVATMIPVDGEDRRRIKRHIEEREGWGFETIEEGLSFNNIIKEGVDPRGIFLLDSLTALLANAMFPLGGDVDFHAAEKLIPEMRAFLQRTGGVVTVSDYIYSDKKTEDIYTEGYRKGLALLDRIAVEECHQVIEVAFGTRSYYKGEKL